MIPILSITNECALTAADSEFHTVTRPDWLVFINWSIRQITTRLRVYKRVWRTDMVEGQNTYKYPLNCIQCTRLQYSLTPTDARLWRDLKDIPSDEWRANTNWTYPTGDPLRYFPDTHELHLDRTPARSIAGGIRMTGWSTPDDLKTDTNTYLPLKDHFRDLVIQGALARSLMKLERESEYAAAVAAFEQVIDTSRSRFEEPSADRRQRMRPATSERLHEMF